MKSTRLAAIVCLLAAGTEATAAREVELFQFSDKDVFAPAMTPDLGLAAKPDVLSQTMREHFAHGISGRRPESPRLPMIGSTGLAPSGARSASIKPTGLGSGTLGCEAVNYARTWWLSPAAERRRSAHFGTISRIACEHGLSPRLLDAVIAQESGYNPWAISSAGAMGMMQIMPGTARSLGLANAFDPVANMRAGARYLRQQLDRFGTIDLALAAYNAGPERRSLANGFIPAIPETMNYVRTITTNWARLAELGRYDGGQVTRFAAARSAVYASGYRNVELISYDGSNAANPM